MAATNINVVCITGNLTRDPELKATQGGTSLCKLRVAVNSRQKRDGEWVDKPNYFNVTVWGTQGENCATYLAKGRPVAIQGRLDWHEWENGEGQKRQAVDIIAESVQFLGDGKRADDDRAVGGSDVPADTSDFEQPAAVGSGQRDDIPF